MRFIALLAVTMIASPAAVFAQDASEQKPVDPAAVQVAPTPSPGVPAAAPAVIPPAEQKAGPRDAITGKPVEDANNPMRPESEKPSLRDKVRSQMDR